MNTLHQNLHEAYRILFASQQAHLLALFRAINHCIDHNESPETITEYLKLVIKNATEHCCAKEELLALTLDEELGLVKAEDLFLIRSYENKINKTFSHTDIKNFIEEFQSSMYSCFVESDNILNYFSRYSVLSLGNFTPGKELSVRISVFDIQHQNIHFLMDNIIKMSRNSKNRTQTLDLIDDLIEKNKLHFDCEEEYMRKYKFPLLDEHLIEHNSFKDQMLRYRDKFSNQTFEASEESLFEIIKIQIENHINDMDKKYTEFFNSLGIK